MKIEKTTLIGDILEFDNSLAPVFMESGMHCLGCMAAAGETVEQACIVHGLDADDLVARLNAALGEE